MSKLWENFKNNANNPKRIDRIYKAPYNYKLVSECKKCKFSEAIEGVPQYHNEDTMLLCNRGEDKGVVHVSPSNWLRDSNDKKIPNGVLVVNCLKGFDPFQGVKENIK